MFVHALRASDKAARYAWRRAQAVHKLPGGSAVLDIVSALARQVQARFDPSRPRPRFRFCISLRNLWYYRNISPVVDELLARGHTVKLVVASHAPEQDDVLALLEAIEARNKKLTLNILERRSETTSKKKKSRWEKLDIALSLAIDRLHFTSRIFDPYPVLRGRSLAKSSGPLIEFFGDPRFRYEPLRRCALACLRFLANRVPAPVDFKKVLLQTKPNLLVVTPLIDVARPQFAELRAAKLTGIRTAVIVHSWDNLSSKSWLRQSPDAIVVWNEFQRREIEQFHGLTTKRVHVCGAPSYDDWFEKREKVDRTSFHEKIGLDPGRRTILYVCSAVFQPPLGNHEEVEFIKSWLSTIRAAADPTLKDANIIIRPHPKRRGKLKQSEFSTFPSVKIWPADAENPIGEAARETYFHSLLHSDAVVGLNTSAFLEAGLLGKPVFTVLDPRFQLSQRGTYHFDWLLKHGGRSGAIRLAKNLEEHATQLGQCLGGMTPFSAEARRFILEFVRPHGAARAATERVCDVLERQAERPKRRPRRGPSEAMKRHVLVHLAKANLAKVIPVRPATQPVRQMIVQSDRIDDKQPNRSEIGSSSLPAA